MNEVTSNPWIWGALALCLMLLAAAVYWPSLAMVLSTSDPGAADWTAALALSAVPLLVGQISRALPNQATDAQRQTA